MLDIKYKHTDKDTETDTEINIYRYKYHASAYFIPSLYMCFSIILSQTTFGDISNTASHISVN